MYPPKPDKTFYESNPVAAKIRQATLDTIGACNEVMKGNEEAKGPLLDANQRLRHLGVVAEMHTIEDDDPELVEKRTKLMSNPVLAAQFVGGQVLSLLEHSESVDPVDGQLYLEYLQFCGQAMKAGRTLPQMPEPVMDLAMRLDGFRRFKIMLDADS